ncbi:MAG: efflux RND transporter periplasmic adaptor subunit [Saprospiraceae bacterium]
MKNMFSLIMICLLSIMISCKSKPADSAKTDKSARLAEVKKQISTLEAEVAKLEMEINPEGKKEKTKLVIVQSFPPTVFKEYIDLHGSVTADQQLFINAKMPGTAQRINIKTGDRVGAGQIVATLDDALVKQSIAEVEQQQSFANDLFEKQKALWDQKLGTEVQFLSAKNNKEAVEKRMATTKEQWAMTKITAPISGIIDEVMIKPGQAVAPGTPIARLINFSKLKITAEVPESFAGKIKAGNVIKIYFPDIQKDYDSHIAYVSPVINVVNRTFKAEAALPANMSGVLPNMIAVIKIVDYTNPRAIVIPINYLQKDSGGDFVMVADSSGGGWKAAKKPVVIGKYYNDLVEIKSGLDGTNKVITNGYQDLIEGMKLGIQIN